MKAQRVWVQCMGGSSYSCDYAEHSQAFASVAEAKRHAMQFWRVQPCSQDVTFWVYMSNPLHDRSGRDYPDQVWTRTRTGGVRVEAA
jgi:hypothetical protein